MTPGIGHNSGRSDALGKSWRRFAWSKARKQLLPTLPVEVVRLRVRRAKELGLPYKTYAGIRASTGHDLIGFLFSNNALMVLREGQGMPLDRVKKLEQLRLTARIAVTHPPVSPDYVVRLSAIDRAAAAPSFSASWSEMRDLIKEIATADGHPADRYVLIGETAFEREWAEAGQMAGYLAAAQYFDGSAQNGL